MPAPIPKIYKVFPTSDDRVFYIAKEEVENPCVDYDLHTGISQRFDHFFTTRDEVAMSRFVDRLNEKTFGLLTQYSEYDYIPVSKTSESGYTVHIVEGVKSVPYRRILRYGFRDLHDKEYPCSVDLDEVFENRLEKIMETANTKSLSSTFSNTPTLRSWIESKTQEYNPSNINEMVYIILNGPPEQKDCGKYPKFNTYEKGYMKFCGLKDKCSCASKEHSDFMLGYHDEKDETFYEERTKKTKETVMDKYGVTHVMHDPQVRKKHEETCLERYEAKSPLESSIVLEKIKETNRENFGVEYPLQSKEIRDKGHVTSRHRYGDPCAPARRAFLEQHNGKNPFIVYSAVIDETNLEKYGDTRPSRTEKVKTKTRKTVTDRYNVPNVSQRHMDPTSVAILDDPYAFGFLCQRYTFWEIKDLLDVSYDVLWDRHDRYEYDFFDRSGRSQYEREIAEWLMTMEIPFKREQRFGLDRKSLDFVIDGKIAVEFNGLFSHSQYSFHGRRLGMHKNYHKEKFDQCKKNGIQLLTVFEDEWINRKHVIKEKILTLLNKGQRGIPARKTKVKDVDRKQSDDFLEKYHLQGSTVSSIRLGAYYEDELIALMTFKDNGDSWELVRFVNDNRSHPGVFSKLLKHFERSHPGEVITSFSDNRWSWGNVYSKNGFSKVGEVEPGYFVTDYKTREHKFNWRKKRIASRFGISIEGKTELELTRELGYDRIWDCGKIKWQKIATP